MKWITRKYECNRNRGYGPDVPAIGVRIYMHHREGQRVSLLLNAAFIKAARLQPGDKLAVGIDEAAGSLGLMRSATGNAISGKGWSEARDKVTKKSTHATPFVSYGCKAFAEVTGWAEARKNTWVLMRDKGTHWESVE